MTVRTRKRTIRRDNRRRSTRRRDNRRRDNRRRSVRAVGGGKLKKCPAIKKTNENEAKINDKEKIKAVSYTHLTLPTIYSV